MLTLVAANVTAAPGDPVIKFEKYVLPNGLEVILAPDPRVPIVAVDVWYHVGSGNETVGRSGFAHLFEHMMFQGSKHVGEDKHWSILKDIGAGERNGTTNASRTNYYEVVPSNQLETALWLESDRMGYLLDRDFAKSFAVQLEVVRNERRERYENEPYGKSRIVLAAALYPERHPYHVPTIGKHEDLVAASVEDVKRFFKTWYVPANATLAIAGDFDVAATKKLVAKWFGSFPKSKKPPLVKPATPALTAREVIASDDLVKLRQITFAWHTPALYAEGDAELDIAAAALARDGGGRLFEALVYARPLADRVTAGQRSGAFSSVFAVVVTLRDDAAIDEVKRIVTTEIATLAKTLVTPSELEVTLAGTEALAIRELQTPLARAEALQRYNHYLGSPDKLSWDLDRYRTTSAEKVRAAVARHLVPDRMLTMIINPGAKP
jgi:zinc protease